MSSAPSERAAGPAAARASETIRSRPMGALSPAATAEPGASAPGAALPVPSAPDPAALASARAVALGWSYTRHKLLDACERALYWQYCGSRDGWRPDAPAEARRAYALKQLADVATLTGQALHTAALDIGSAIRDRRARPTYDGLLAAARHLLNTAWRTSQPDRVRQWWRWPADHVALREIVVHGRLEQPAVEQARVRLASGLRHLVQARVFDDLAETVAMLGAAAVQLPGKGPDRFLVETAMPGGEGAVVTAWAALDLLYRHVDPGRCQHLVGGACWCVVDYKSGYPAPADEQLQMSVYGLALESQGYPMTDGVYLGRVVHLRSGTDTWYALGPEHLARARAVIGDDTARQLRLFAPGRDGVASGTPDDAADDALSPSAVLPSARAFALAADPRRCTALCNFFGLCRDELLADAPNIVPPVDAGPGGGAVEGTPGYPRREASGRDGDADGTGIAARRLNA